MIRSGISGPHSPGMLMGLPWASRSAPMKRPWFREELSTPDELLSLAELLLSLSLNPPRSHQLILESGC